VLAPIWDAIPAVVNTRVASSGRRLDRRRANWSDYLVRMKSIAISKFKAHCLALLEDVARTGEPVVVTKRGKPLARVVPTGAKSKYPQRSLAGTVTILGDVISPAVPAGAWNAVTGQVIGRASRKSRRRR
jgi:prevent-host-death family protein